MVSPKLLTYPKEKRESAYRGRSRGRGCGGCLNVAAGMYITLRDLTETGSSTAGEESTRQLKNQEETHV